RPLATIR
ncbi:rhs element Vgr family protein, partial [Escherichia coli 96.0427]